MAAMKPFFELKALGNAPVLPHGYQTMALIALVPSEWRRVMDPLLADWDYHFASDAERSLVSARPSVHETQEMPERIAMRSGPAKVQLQ